MVAKPDSERTASTYAMAERIVDTGLRKDDSLFTPGRAIWTSERFAELEQEYVQGPDLGKRTFLEKLRTQLGQSSQEAVQLAAELLYTLYLPVVMSIGGDKKREQIREVLSWLDTPVDIPADMADELDRGFGSGGTGFNTNRNLHFSYLVRFRLAW
jgi:5-methylcytosine-specific restriction protein B